VQARLTDELNGCVHPARSTAVAQVVIIILNTASLRLQSACSYASRYAERTAATSMPTLSLASSAGQEAIASFVLLWCYDTRS
jgi:hypothetical protein